jgi:hypothetical protein
MVRSKEKEKKTMTGRRIERGVKKNERKGVRKGIRKMEDDDR